MDIGDTHNYAKQLLETRGELAEAYAAGEERKCAEVGETEKAENWRKIRLAVKEMRGAHAS